MKSEFDIKMAGHGGQGIMVMGKLLAEAGLEEGKEVVFFPAYGGEMRGGFANCTLVISNKKIASPYRSHPKALVAMNIPSLEKFQKELLPGSTLIYNSSLVKNPVLTAGLKVLALPISELADQAGNPRAANIIALIFVVLATGVVELDTVKRIVQDFFSGRKQDAQEANLRAIEIALDYWMQHVKEDD